MPVGFGSYPPQQAQYAQYPNTYGASPQATGPPTPGFAAAGALPSPGIYQGQPQTQFGPAQPQVQPQQQYAQVQQQAYVPVTQQPQQQPQQTYDLSAINNDIHQQLYRPEGAPAKAPPPKAGPGQPGAVGKLEKRVEKLEKGVNRFFKKLDK
jgi:hypothetical protein